MQPQRTKRRKKSKGPAILLVLLVLLVICASAIFGVYRCIKGYNKALDPDNAGFVVFEIPTGSSTSSIAQKLEDAGLIGNADLFKFKTRFMALDGKYQAGKYKLSPSMTMEEIMVSIQDAHRDVKRFTIPEGYTLWEIGQSLEAQGIVASADDFYTALEKPYDYWFVRDRETFNCEGFGGISPMANRLEGFLFPDTYEVFSDAAPEEIIDKMLSQFSQVLTEDCREVFTSNDSEVLEKLLIKASMIEREAGTDSDKPLVASVIENRLKKNMQLQIDATVQYAQGEFKERLLYSDLEIDSPYNTYVIYGLPQGPICCPGRESLKAALDPADTDYLYYVLKPDGSTEHNFASDYNTFLKYKKQYTDSL